MNRLFTTVVIILPLMLVASIASRALAQDASKMNPPVVKSQEPSKPKQETKEEDCGCDAKPPADLAAMVNGKKILFKDVDEPIQQKIDELQKQVVEARRNELQRRIDGRLLQAEAKRRGITLDRLQGEILATAKEPTEAEAQAYYDQNREQIQSVFADVKESIIGYLRSQRQQEAIKSAADKLRPAANVRISIPDPPAPQSEADRARVCATVNGSHVTLGEIDDALRSSVFDVKQQMYMLRKQSLDGRINRVLLEEEARRRNISPETLFDTEIAGLIQPVKESDARRFYEENKERISGAYIQVHAQIVEYLQGQEQTKAAATFADKLRATARVQTYLEPPESPLFEISTDDQPWRGNPDAGVTVIEFTDFQCPSCGRTHPVLDQVITEMGDKVRLVVRDFPLEIHAYAEKAAEAAEAARAQGKYWEYAAMLFEHQNALTVDNLKVYASQLGLDRVKFDKALDSGQYADQVKRDLREGNDLGVNSTPSIFVNGRKVQDRTAEGLRAAIEAALRATAKTATKKQNASPKPVASQRP